MDYIKARNKNKHQIERSLKKITNSEILASKVFSYILLNKEILGSDEYVKVKTNSLLRSFLVRYHINKSCIAGITFSINIKKTTIILLAFLFDYQFGIGITSLALHLSGFTKQVLHKIENNEKCIIADIIISKKKNSTDFNYFEKGCVQNDIDCPYREDFTCRRTTDNVDNQLQSLFSKNIIQKKNGIFKQVF